MSKKVKKVVSAVKKIVKAIVKVVKFIVDAAVGFVKKIFSGDLMTILMVVMIVFLGPAGGFGLALLAWGQVAGLLIGTVLLSEYQTQQAEKMAAKANDDLDRQAALEEERLKASNQEHFDQMEEERYNGYESGQFGVSPVLTSDASWSEYEGNFSLREPSSTSYTPLLLIGAGITAYHLQQGGNDV